MKKTKIILAIVLLIILIVGGFFYFQNWWQVKQEKIKLGLASDNFPWRDYTEEELAEMYPQIKYADVPTRVTPEETYAKFREALRTNNLEMAIEQFNNESEAYQANISTLDSFYKENKFQELYQYYPEEIRKANMYESIAQYEYDYYSLDYKQDLVGGVDFVKDANGDWKLDSL